MYTNIDNKQIKAILSIDNLIYIILLSKMSIDIMKKILKNFKVRKWKKKIK